MMNDEDWDALLPPIRAGAAFEEILRDLIAELRSMAEHSDHLTEWIGPTLERAEQRLRQVQGE